MEAAAQCRPLRDARKAPAALAPHRPRLLPLASGGHRERPARDVQEKRIWSSVLVLGFATR